MNLALDSGSVMTFLLLRFAVIAVGVAILVVVGFAVLVVLRRKGRLDDARKYAEPVFRAWMENRRGRRR
ncbi:hypothetical protein LX15_001232 [Streptoalloteichus tenebrarius]|uniref:Uncharacterized protein n=1 Tax=Streptoalloteichus tenebrarius (strain ATCC 17920 / DSM 40477 / JCM 4838 / CBS 697.72 / NBRC 16177 / NCIMB 11028 / NRRL B-12390 / A12253. 1 / ISP 5477) TaxID=1933 RepID=A0ABT1HPV7_STRSD|nr:hypothetical protein [Streptoalloteichus tenebrarius]MCP2257547.1 hypothetical protein [Streptoalloteichus tenebrarius]BFE98498.1 hypothetical protein GCM10020241_01740 [Streptoalloteichus tenebrarius]